MTFEFVITSSDREVAKPDPRLFREASGAARNSCRRDTARRGPLVYLGMSSERSRSGWERPSTEVSGAGRTGTRHGDLPGDAPPEIPRWDDLEQAEGCFSASQSVSGGLED